MSTYAMISMRNGALCGAAVSGAFAFFKFADSGSFPFTSPAGILSVELFAFIGFAIAAHRTVRRSGAKGTIAREPRSALIFLGIFHLIFAIAIALAFVLRFESGWSNIFIGLWPIATYFLVCGVALVVSGFRAIGRTKI